MIEIPDTTPDLRLERDRLQTFRSWRYSHIVKPEDLAAAGFFSLCDEDLVKCFECGIMLHRWKDGDVPMNEHRIWSRCCGYVHGANCGNVPIGANPSAITPQPRGIDVCGYQILREMQQQQQTSSPDH
ncbi:baculoviral IAP repeat-containing protein 7-A-like [Lasioglossum baleicum]|uniref:baculoviral IAP repeat-containing protein 7-A-like n=1 Tax=Lasioglossum baleicum TaxID=434251 RepID=UPI003FCD8B3A